MACQCCRFEVPTRHVEFKQNIGMVATRLTRKVEGELCRTCAGRYFRSYTLTTLFLGWWGVISFILTPVILIGNFLQYRSTRDLPEPSMAATNIPLGVPPLPIASGSFSFKLIYGLVVWTGIAAAIAYHYVESVKVSDPSQDRRMREVEKHLRHQYANATGEYDTEGAELQFEKDTTALEADFKSKQWQGVRSEFLAREEYVTDLSEMTHKLQNQASREDPLGVGFVHDPCERFALEELVPAMSNYSAAWDHLLAFAKANPKLTQRNKANLDALDDEKHAAYARINQYFVDKENRGCNK
jgi:hypothetical protein